MLNRSRGTTAITTVSDEVSPFIESRCLVVFADELVVSHACLSLRRILELHLKRQTNRPAVEERDHVVEVCADGARARERHRGSLRKDGVAVGDVEEIDLARKALRAPPAS